MKRVLTVLSLLCVPLLAFTENKIKMVTYFPVPYVAYSKINASKQLDVGLTSACEMNLGCAESGALGKRPLQATTVNLNKGRLDLNTAAAVKSTNVTLGSASGEANIDFSKNLRIGTLNNGYSLEATEMNVSSLTLFRSHMSSDSAARFPSCATTGAAGAPQISWQKVKLKNAEEVYLLCGTPKETKCEPPSGQSTTQSCPSGYTGTQTRTWNYSTCAWNAWQGTCTPVKKYRWTYVSYSYYTTGQGYGCDRPNSNGCYGCDEGCARMYDEGDCSGECSTPGDTCTELRGALDPQYSCNDCEVQETIYECQAY